MTRAKSSASRVVAILAWGIAATFPLKATALDLAIEATEVRSGEVVSLQVRVAEAEALGSVYAEIEYGGPALELIGINPGADDLNLETNPEIFPVQSGLLRLAGTFEAGFEGDGPLVEMSFALPDSILGNFPVTFRRVRVHRVDGAAVEADLTDGGFRVVATAVEEGGDPRPGATHLLPNYPNPFNPATYIPFQLREETHVVFRIYSTSGQRIRTLELGRRPAGYYAGRGRAAHWDGRDDRGREAASGVYLVVLRAGERRLSQKVTLIK